MIVLFLTGVVAMIMLRTLRKDISSYNDMQTLEEAQEESGWKLVHGDVFRPPTFSPMLLSVLAGMFFCLIFKIVAHIFHSRNWFTAFSHDMCYHFLCAFRASVSRQPWISINGAIAALCLHGIYRRLCIRQSL